MASTHQKHPAPKVASSVFVFGFIDVRKVDDWSTSISIVLDGAVLHEIKPKKSTLNKGKKAIDLITIQVLIDSRMDQKSVWFHFRVFHF